MARGFKLFNFLLVLVLVLLGSSSEARPLSILKSDGSRVWDKGFFDGLSLGAIKQSGPSPGQGNKYIDSQAFRSIRKDGPSPGEGH